MMNNGAKTISKSRIPIPANSFGLQKFKKHSGFTLFEILLVMALFLVLGVVFVPFSITQLTSTRTDITSNNLISNMFTIQSKAYAGTDNSSYGMQFNNTNFVVVRGESLQSYSSFDRYDYEAGVTLESISLSGGANTIFFTKGSLKPDRSGSLVVSDGFNKFKIDITSEGMIDHYKLQN